MVHLPTPADVTITEEPREPVWDPTVGVPHVPVPTRGDPPHRLVTIGDSLLHGFQSGAVFNTDISCPAIIAHELGWLNRFRCPRYDSFGGLPLNIELMLRELERSFGKKLDWWEVPLALFHVRQFMDQVEDYWERGPGSVIPRFKQINHNLAMYGWDLRDALSMTGKLLEQNVKVPKDDLIHQFVENATERAAMRVYPMTNEAINMMVFDAAARLGEEPTDAESGVETLVVFLGANNALGSVVRLEVVWSGSDYNDPARKGKYTVWRPTHFIDELHKVAGQVRGIKARHVIWCTVPHVTIAPLARGVGTKVRPGSRYFPYYTRPWIPDNRFNPAQDPHITAAEARAVDSAIDQYNVAITDLVRKERSDPTTPRDWYLLDVAGILDRLAHRRYVEDPLARPDWWQPYPLPPQLRALRPVPDSRFLTSDGNRRATGGLFSLDGVHPTTVGYGILAQEMINIMRLAGVSFRLAGGSVRPDPVTVDFDRLIRRDTLINTPPALITSGLGILSWADEALDLIRRTLSFRL